jgi:lauroyl/myristoyl acyltransferase
MWIEKTDDPDGDVDMGLAKGAQTLESAIGSMPDQWVMFQRVWPT